MIINTDYIETVTEINDIMSATWPNKALKFTMASWSLVSVPFNSQFILIWNKSGEYWELISKMRDNNAKT